MYKKIGKEFELVSFGLLPIYLEIICEQYEILVHYNKSIRYTFCKNNYSNKHSSTLFIATIFTAMFLEAYIYDYCVRKSSKNKFNKYFCNLSTVEKWNKITNEFNNKGIDHNLDNFSKLKKLFKLRNKLSHNETLKLNNNSKSILNELVKPPTPQECIDLIMNTMKSLLEIDNNELYAQSVIEDLNKLYPLIKYKSVL